MRKGSLTQLPPFIQLIFVLCMVIVSAVVITAIGVVAALPFTGLEEVAGLLQGTGSIAFMKYLQVLQSFAIFIVPSVLAAWFFSEKPAQWLGFNDSKTTWIILSMATILAIQPFVSYIGMVNAQITLPDYLEALYRWMHQTEQSANEIIFRFLDTQNLSVILFNVFMIAILPALGEEMLFRGGLQPLIQKMVKNHHAAIWITAFLFSAMHMQFLTFAPRFILGGVLGYLLVYGAASGTPLPPIFSTIYLLWLSFITTGIPNQRWTRLMPIWPHRHWRWPY
ncbi:CPBP family intramembrane glutamic endopeptidase [Geofilum rubicundum]|uniref:CAAX prenyl protease 2/Lysostaphin resistance protein A-like domain-containing protein n=1 Tax=Geofilum rubicundum JCM 15548 TaxID=1236989 RepID=A0A0E9LX02_9BACT|nr:CPBP family intramembrane glutamic endopeptidase [Geofilum rubicundum]GAO29380.1 hypothetical protein JCM15548_11559 [Geofilum rubicundum JCM 15548]